MPGIRTIAIAMALLISTPIRAGDPHPPANGAAWAHPSWPPDHDPLLELVEEDVRRDLAEAAPWFDLHQLEDFAARRRKLTAPLNGRANKALWRLVPVLLARGEPALAHATIELLRNPGANLNPKVIHQGTMALAEAARADAPTSRASLKALRRALGSLPASRFHEATAELQTMMLAAAEGGTEDLPYPMASRLEHITSHPLTPRAAAEYLHEVYIHGAIWRHLEEYQEVWLDVRMQVESRQPRPLRLQTVDMKEHASRAHPVVIGVLDSGVSPARCNMYQNPRERENGLDDDGNGVVDDIHGLVWDWDPHRRHQHSNMDLVETLPMERVEEYETYILGAYHKRQGWNTEESVALEARLLSLTGPEDREAFVRGMSEVGQWAHGTHVAGLVVAGNRWAQVASFRFAWTSEARIYRDRGPTDQELRWERESILELVDWLNTHDVRILNASFGFTLEHQEDALARELDVLHPDRPARARLDQHGRPTHEPDPELVRERARQIMEFRRESMRILFEACPMTLFVLAAGNDDHDVVEYGDVPVTISSPHDNVLVVGAVDRTGQWAPFTNYNRELVQLFHVGEDVFSWSPSGRMLPMSGTSVAAPAVAGVAGKLLTLYPSLTPAQVKAILLETAAPFKKPFYGGLVDEVKAMKRAARVAGEDSAGR